MSLYAPGTVIADRYEVAGRPLLGGMGIVYICMDRQAGRPVALKVFWPEYLPDRAARAVPDNLGERRHLLWPDAHLDYYAGLAQQALGDRDAASASFRRVLDAKAGLSEMTYYQALALRQLDRGEEATARLQEMLDGASRQLKEEAESGFATSVPEFVFAEGDLETRRRTHHTYLVGLAHLGLGGEAAAAAAFKKVLERDPNHFGAAQRLRQLG